MIGLEDCPELGLPKGGEADAEEGSHSANIKHLRLDLFPHWAGVHTLYLPCKNSISSFVQECKKMFFLGVAEECLE